jgi:hypothetical protein
MDLGKSINIESDRLPLPWKPGNVSNLYTFHAGDTATLRFNCPVDGVTKARFAIAHSGDNGYLYLTVTVKDHALVNSTLELDPTYGPLPKQFRLAVDKTNEVLDDAYELIPTKPGDKTETKATP